MYYREGYSMKGSKVSVAVILAITLAAGVSGCANLNDPYGSGGGPYNSPPPYYGGSPYYGGDGGYYAGDPYRRERSELERERARLEAERLRLERERQRDPYNPPITRPSPQQDRCPPGFSPSERKCTPDERRRGCRDIRMPSGLGCVDRR